jgi:hypothetical protein
MKFALSRVSSNSSQTKGSHDFLLGWLSLSGKLPAVELPTKKAVPSDGVDY